MKKTITITIFLLITCAALNAQTADFIQTLLKTQAVSYSQAARFVLEAADVSGQDAMRLAIENKWLPQKAQEQDAISLEELSLLIMQAFNLKGGPMYSWLRNAHYSYRELVFQDIIQGRSDPQMKVSGERMIFIVNRLLYNADEDPWEFSVNMENKK